MILVGWEPQLSATLSPFTTVLPYYDSDVCPMVSLVSRIPKFGETVLLDPESSILDTYISGPPPDLVQLSITFDVRECVVKSLGTCVRAQTWREAIDKATAKESIGVYDFGERSNNC